MITVEEDGAYYLLSLDAGLNGLTLRLTHNEFAHLIEKGHAMLHPPRIEPVGPDEETT